MDEPDKHKFPEPMDQNTACPCCERLREVDIERIMEVVFDVYLNILDPDGGRSNMLRTRLTKALTPKP